MKYHSPNTDLAALQRELGRPGQTDTDTDEYEEYDAEADVDDDQDDGADDDGDWAARRR